MSKMTIVISEWRDMIVPIALKAGGTKSTDAMVYGCFATHIVRDEKGERIWSVSHIPTGLQLATYPNASTWYEITPIVVKVHDAYGDEWNTESVNRVRSMATACKHIWQLEAVQS